MHVLALGELGQREIYSRYMNGGGERAELQIQNRALYLQSVKDAAVKAEAAELLRIANLTPEERAREIAVAAHKKAVAQAEAERIQYVRDIRGVETLQTPLVTMKIRQGDCDDQSVLLAALLESIGHPTRFVAIKQNFFGPYVHVYTETKIGPKWIPLETTEKMRAGAPMNYSTRMVVNN